MAATSRLLRPVPGASFTVNAGTLNERVATVVEVGHTYDGRHRLLVTYHVPGVGFGAYIPGLDCLAEAVGA